MIKEICISGSFLLTERERITPTAIKFLHARGTQARQGNRTGRKLPREDEESVQIDERTLTSFAIDERRKMGL